MFVEVNKGKIMNSNLKLLVFGILVTACSKEKAAPPVTIADCSNEISFSAQVHPIIHSRCANNMCHDNFMYGSDILLNNYADIKTAATADKFLKAIKHEPGASAMPMNGAKLNMDEIQVIECWINQGMKNN